MKTNILTIAFVLFNVIARSQNENTYTSAIKDSVQHIVQIKYPDDYQEQIKPQRKLYPVYFNYSKRQLRDSDKNIISPIEFLNLCRSINDSAVQQQVARYDSYTRDKQKLGLVALGSGFSAFALLGSAVSLAEQNNNNASASFGFFGAIAFLAVPAIAIYSSVPHQKRKAVLFRDLPIAYNHYVEICQ